MPTECPTPERPVAGPRSLRGTRRRTISAKPAGLCRKYSIPAQFSSANAGLAAAAARHRESRAFLLAEHFLPRLLRLGRRRERQRQFADRLVVRQALLPHVRSACPGRGGIDHQRIEIEDHAVKRLGGILAHIAAAYIALKCGDIAIER